MPICLNHNMIKKIVFISCVYFIAACNKPAHLPMNKMSKILLKMHLAEGYAQVLPKNEPLTDGKSGSMVLKNEDSLLKYNAMILKEFNITKTDFQQSLQYYKRNPELLDSIYQMVLSDIAILQAENKKK